LLRANVPPSLQTDRVSTVPLFDCLQTLLKFIPPFQWFDCYFIGSNEASGEVENKLRTVMRVLAAHRSSVFENVKPNPDEYSVMGYDYTQEQL
jgi:hypothetical protein